MSRARTDSVVQELRPERRLAPAANGAHWPHAPFGTTGGGSALVGEPHEHLAGVGAVEEAEERRRRLLEPLQLRPAYLDTLLRGARAIALPDAYIARLEAIEHNGYDGARPH